MTVNSISDSFANGHIDINGSVSKSGFCYDANGTFHGTVTFSISGTTLTPNLDMDQPNVDVEIPWYCWLAAGVVLGPIGLALVRITDAVADPIATSLAGDALKNALGGGIPGTGISGLAGASFRSVAVTTEGITLQGRVPITIYDPLVWPKLTLSGSVMTTQSQEVGSGIFHTQLWCMPEAKDYPYTESAQQQRGVYQLSGTMVSQPLTPHYTISSNGTTIPLTGTSGTIALPNVDTHYPMPLATGGTAMQQTVHIGYTISGTGIQLTNVPSEGDYAFYLNVTATDCKGNPVQDDSQSILSTWVHVQFEGDHVDIGGGYGADVQHCAQLLAEWIKRITQQYMPQQKVPIWQQVNYPPPEGLIEYIRDLIALGIPQADEVLVASKIAHGNSFYRALLSPAASQPGLLRAKSGIAGNQQIANIALDLTSLTQQLLSVGGVTQIAEVVRGIREIEG